MSVRLSKVCAALALFSIATRASAQLREPLRIGERLPVWRLTTATPNSSTVKTSDFLGKKSQFWILESGAPLLKDPQAVVKSAQAAVTKGVLPLAVRAPFDSTLWPAPFQTLSANFGEFANVSMDSSTFVAVDRAGWVRDIEPLPSATNDPQNFTLRFILERSPDPTPVFEVGKPAPDFCLSDADGIPRRLSALRGRKNFVLTFFPKCFTGKCKSHLSSLRDNYGAFQLADTEIWAVSVDAASGEEGQRAFAKSLSLPFPLLPDEGRNVCLLFGAVETPGELAKRQSVLIDKDGIVRWIDRDVAPLTHGEDLLARLKTLGLIP